MQLQPMTRIKRAIIDHCKITAFCQVGLVMNLLLYAQRPRWQQCVLIVWKRLEVHPPAQAVEAQPLVPLQLW